MNSAEPTVENLRRLENEALEQPLSEVKRNNHFGSYRLYKHGLPNNVDQLNLQGPRATTYVQTVAQIIRRRRATFARVLDVGSGLGFVTAELAKQFRESVVSGLEMSKDGVDLANESFPHLEFQCLAWEPTTRLSKKYDLIHCREFYPFTRTSSVEFCLNYLRSFSENLLEGGILAVTLIDKPESLYEVLPKVLEKIESTELIYLGKKPLPSYWLSKIFPFATLANFATTLVNKATKRPSAYLLLFKKSEL